MNESQYDIGIHETRASDLPENTNPTREEVKELLQQVEGLRCTTPINMILDNVRKAADSPEPWAPSDQTRLCYRAIYGCLSAYKRNKGKQT